MAPYIVIKFNLGHNTITIDLQNASVLGFLVNRISKLYGIPAEYRMTKIIG